MSRTGGPRSLFANGHHNRGTHHNPNSNNHHSTGRYYDYRPTADDNDFCGHDNHDGAGELSSSYPDFCIPPPPPDLNCGDIRYKNFTVLPPDPHEFDGNNDGVGCES